MPFAQFNRDKLRLLPLSERIHDIDLSVMLDPHAKPSITHPDIPLIADRIRSARDTGSSVLMMMGGHVIRSGAAPVIM